MMALGVARKSRRFLCEIFGIVEEFILGMMFGMVRIHLKQRF
jgi:hypothetical protein